VRWGICFYVSLAHNYKVGIYVIEVEGLRRRRSWFIRHAGFKLETKKRGSWFRVRKVVERANVVLEVLDSRDPLGTRSLELERLVKGLGKKFLLVLNKADLVPRSVVSRWTKYFESRGCIVFSVSAKKGGDIARMRETLKRVAKHLAKKKRVVVAIVGYPNVGKSTIINGFKGRYVTETSPIPGFTIGEKLVRIDEDLMVLDTPGLLPSRKLSAYKLALGEFIPPEKLRDPLNPAMRFLDEILRSMPSLLKETYGIEAKEPYSFLELLAAKRGFLIKGGEPNTDEAARTILRDWQSGKLKFYKVLED